ncbi:hypothetical protein Q8G35_01865 [Peribacillus simplex]|uniref:Uncharacterized protein n=2 Tax=Peribacillus TaxID=2675229 RepID=A0AA90PAU1_9BACI|nr:MULTISPECIES: hypothetical protein [Peribacillus]MDP1417152.1 hypothetical protein [Peribacillus simplex]MDP1449807.1 hypothetical protein [Peribacillus frigoritolerans]
MKLINEKGTPWGDKKQKNKTIIPLDFSEIQEQSLFIGVSLASSYHHNERDCIVLMYKDRTNWEMKTNNNEDAFEFLYRNIKFFSKNRYKKVKGSFLKEYLIFTIGACLSTPVKPEYYIRDVDVEKNDCNQINPRWQPESYLKISDWLNHFPISGASKRVYLETSPHKNFPFNKKEIREMEKEKDFLVEVCKKIVGLSSSIQNIKGWNEENFKDEYYRDAFVSMLVSIAYTRWKSNDKSGRDDFLKVIVDHDGLYWLLDHESLNQKQGTINMEKPLSDERG